jgi:hypothetical protein
VYHAGRNTSTQRAGIVIHFGDVGDNQKPQNESRGVVWKESRWSLM